MNVITVVANTAAVISFVDIMNSFKLTLENVLHVTITRRPTAFKQLWSKSRLLTRLSDVTAASRLIE